jgi:hypothetical protein
LAHSDGALQAIVNSIKPRRSEAIFIGRERNFLSEADQILARYFTFISECDSDMTRFSRQSGQPRIAISVITGNSFPGSPLFLPLEEQRAEPGINGKNPPKAAFNRLIIES